MSNKESQPLREEEERILALWRDEGLTFVMVARRLGMTKGQVAGIIHRAKRKLARWNGPIDERHSVKTARGTRSSGLTFEESGKTGITILGLKKNSCRWMVTPLDDFPGGYYCGERVAYGRYCDKHARRAYPCIE